MASLFSWQFLLAFPFGPFFPYSLIHWQQEFIEIRDTRIRFFLLLLRRQTKSGRMSAISLNHCCTRLVWGFATRNGNIISHGFNVIIIYSNHCIPATWKTARGLIEHMKWKVSCALTQERITTISTHCRSIWKIKLQKCDRVNRLLRWVWRVRVLISVSTFEPVVQYVRKAQMLVKKSPNVCCFHRYENTE